MMHFSHIPSVKKSHIVLYIALVCIVIAAGGYTYYRHQTAQIRQEKFLEIKAIADLKESQITAWLEVCDAEVNVFIKASFFKRYVGEWQKNPQNITLKHEIIDRLKRFQSELNYENILLLSRQGTILVSSQPDTMALQPVTRNTLDRAMQSLNIECTDFYYCPIHKKIHYDIIAPLLDKEGHFLAFVLFRRDPNNYLFPLVQHWPTPSRTSETLIIRKEGDSVLFLNSLRHLATAPLTFKRPLTMITMPAAQAVLGRIGIHEGVDYRGVEVLSELRSIPGTNWFMVAKVDKDEIFSDLYTGAFTIVGFCLLLITLVILGIIWVYHRRQRNMYRALYIKEKELWQSQEQFKVTIDSLGEGIIMTDVHGNLTYMNSIAEMLTGWEQHEAHGKNITEIYTARNEETGEVKDHILEKVLRDGSIKELDNHTILTSKKGKAIPVMDTAAPIYDIDDSVIGLVLTFQDETEKRLQQRIILENEQRFRSSLDNLLEGCQIISHDWRYLYINKIAAQHGHMAREHYNGKTMQELYPGIESMEMFSALKRCMENQTACQMENKFSYPDGTYGWFKLSIQSVPEGLLILSEDITEKKSLERQMLRSQRMESIGTLAGGIAHDLNNVFAPVLMSLSLLKKRLPDANSQSMLQMIETVVTRGAELIKQMLSFARGVDGEFRTVKLQPCISEVTKIIEETFPKNIKLRVDIAPALGLLLGDPTQIHQLLMNICVNARDAMPSGGTITLSASMITIDEQFARMHIDATPGLFVVMTITDQGVGISQANLDRIFEPFFTTKEVGKGTGLGLSTVFSIVKHHGGFIQVESELGKGTIFKVYLPVQQNGEPAAFSHEPASILQTGSGELILVVDDEESVREITKASLEENGYSVLTAEDGTEAAKIYAEQGVQIAAVITDMVMPFMDGSTTIRVLQKMNPHIKIITMSGLKQDPELTNDHRVLFLQKPFTTEVLLKQVGALLHC